MIFPSKISKGDFIGTTAPSMGCLDEVDIKRLESAHEFFNLNGYKLVETENVRTNSKLVSSSAKDRAEQFIKLWEDPKIKWIIATGGGELLIEILPFLDKDRILNASPKWVQGFSDISLILYYLTTNFNIATIHSYNVKGFGMEPLHDSFNASLSIAEGATEILQKSFDRFQKEHPDTNEECPLKAFNLTDKVSYKSLYEDRGTEAKGRVIGGCVDVFGFIAGMEFDNTVNFVRQFDEGMLWYLDNCELPPQAFYRALWKMREMHWFDNANGFLIGRTAMTADYFDFTYLDALHKIFDDMSVPVFYDVDIGHLEPQWAMINGSYGKFVLNSDKGRLIQKIGG